MKKNTEEKYEALQYMVWDLVDSFGEETKRWERKNYYTFVLGVIFGMLTISFINVLTDLIK